MKLKGKNFIIPYVVYPFDYMFSFGQSDENLFKLLRNKGIVDPEVVIIRGNARCVMFENGQTVIRLRVVPSKPHEYGYLQHEIFHAVDFLFNRIGIELSEKSNEAYAYLIEYLTKEVYERI